MKKPSNNYPIETIIGAQQDMKKAYANGALGVLISGMIWLSSAIVVYYLSESQAIWYLLIGGVLIYPLSIIINKIFGLKGKHKPGNPLAKTALEGTVFMLMCIPLAYELSLQYNEWFFQAMLMIIGGRYLTFESIYGNKMYWILGGTLGAFAYFLYYYQINSFYSALAGAFIEISFGVVMLIQFLKSNANSLRKNKIRHHLH